MRGVDQLCVALKQNGVDVVFGLPGTQNIALFDAIRRSGLRSTSTTNELSAAFAANGFARAGGRPATLAVIPGPGFTYALTGIAEARLDSVPLVCLIGEPASHPHRHFQLQAIAQKEIAAPLVKAYYRLESAEHCERVISEAFKTAASGEPGPVIVELADGLNRAASEAPVVPAPIQQRTVTTPHDPVCIAEIVAALHESRRTILMLGQGAREHGDAMRELRSRLGAVVIASTSGRGVISEAENYVLSTDLRSPEVINELLESADLILGLGVKLSHNGCSGFEMRLTPGKFIHVDSDPSVLNANYPTRNSLVSTVGAFLGIVLEKLTDEKPQSLWTDQELESWQVKLDAEDLISGVNPQVSGMRNAGMPEFFGLLRSCMPSDSHLVCDSGMHQMLARRHYPVYRPSGLIVPTDFQSMGYGIPAAIGARTANPASAVAALVGDGGLLINGLELVTAVKKGLSIPVFVFVDGYFGLIRHQQIERFGSVSEVKLPSIDMSALASSIGADYALADDKLRDSIRKSLNAGRPTLIEVRLSETAGMRLHQAKRAAVETAERTLGPKQSRKIRALLNTLRGKNRQ